MNDPKKDPHAELMALADTYAIEDGLCLGSSKAEDARDALDAFARTLTDRLERAERMFGAACADLGAINEALGLDPDDGGAEPIIDAIQELQSCVGAGVTPPDPTLRAMNRIAQDYAHRLALALECVLFDYPASGKWYDSTMQVLGDYRSAMNAISEQESPTFMGEPLIKDKS